MILRFLVVLLLAGMGFSQSMDREFPSSHTILIFPFENTSNVPGLEWIGESFPELIGQRMASPTLYPLPRENRLVAYERMGIPGDLHPSRATLYRIAEQLDVDYAILGHYGFDGRSFTAVAQLLDMRHSRLFPAASESGPLVDLINVQTALAFDELHSLRSDLTVSRQGFVASAPPIRLDAFENYVRGIVATSNPEKIRRFKEAVRISPPFPQALLLLGKTLFKERNYIETITWLNRMPESDPLAREARFYIGMAAYYQGDFGQAESAFNFVASRMPLTEVYNNLGVVAARRGRKSAASYFQKAVEADPTDADYRFNLALTLYKAGDLPGAARQLHEAQAQNPGDSEARSLQETIAQNASSPPDTPAPSKSRMPMERIRTNYDESSFRQLALTLQGAMEQKLAQSDPGAHARFHVERGQEWLSQGFMSEAEREFREALQLESGNAEAHAGLARVLENNDDRAGARSEAEAALRLQALVDPYLVLARLDLADNNVESAARNLDQALHLAPANGAALALKRAVTAKLAQKAQPLPIR